MPDELIGGFAVEAAAELLRVLDRLGAMAQRVRDAVVQHLRDTCSSTSGPRSRRMTLPPRGSGKPAGPLEPPFAQIDDLVQAVGRVGELPFVNQQPRVHAAFEHGAIDLIERHDLEARNDGS